MIYPSILFRCLTSMIRTKTDEIYGNNPVTTATDLRRQIVNIDSRFRKTAVEPSTDFSYALSRPYKNIIRVSVASVELPLPLGIYNVSYAKKNNQFRLDAMDYIGHQHFFTVQIPDGEYPTPDALVAAIQESLHGLRDQYGVFFRVTYDARTRRVTFHHDGSAPPPCPAGPTHCPVAFGLTFMMVGQEDHDADFGLGALLGFIRPFYVVESPFQLTAESPVQLYPDRYFLLEVNDYYAVEHRTDAGSILSCMTKIPIVYDHTVCGLRADSPIVTEVVFTKPQDVHQVRIRLLDAHGEPVALYDQNWSISLVLTEVMNIQLYDFYRTTQWTEAEPRAVKQTSGSSAGIAPPALNYH
jgi:hypothetical protein